MYISNSLVMVYIFWGVLYERSNTISISSVPSLVVFTFVVLGEFSMCCLLVCKSIWPMFVILFMYVLTWPICTDLCGICSFVLSLQILWSELHLLLWFPLLLVPVGVCTLYYTELASYLWRKGVIIPFMSSICHFYGWELGRLRMKLLFCVHSV